MIGELPVVKPATAFFAGASYDVVTTNSTDRVLRWSLADGAWRSRELYQKDDAEILCAEPDRVGDDLLVDMMMPGGITDSLYYSVAVQKPWRDFGSGAHGVFDEHGDIVMDGEDVDGIGANLQPTRQTGRAKSFAELCAGESGGLPQFALLAVDLQVNLERSALTWNHEFRHCERPPDQVRGEAIQGVVGWRPFTHGLLRRSAPRNDAVPFGSNPLWPRGFLSSFLCKRR